MYKRQGAIAAGFIAGGTVAGLVPVGMEWIMILPRVIVTLGVAIFLGIIATGISWAMWWLTGKMTWIIAITARDRFIGDTPDEEETKLEDFKGFTGAYANILNGAVRTPFWTMGAAFAIVVLSFTASSPNTGFFPEVDPEQFIINVKERGNLSIEEKEERAEQVQSVVFDMQREYGEFANFRLVASGTNPGEDTIATIDIELTDCCLLYTSPSPRDA